MDPGPRSPGDNLNPPLYLGISTLPRIVCRSGTPLALSWLWALVGRILRPLAQRGRLGRSIRRDGIQTRDERKRSRHEPAAKK